MQQKDKDKEKENEKQKYVAYNGKNINEKKYPGYKEQIDKLKEEQLDGKQETTSKKTKDNSENINEAISGLMVLGYSKKDIEKAFEHLDIDNLSIEDLIKKGLILLSQK